METKLLKIIMKWTKVSEDGTHVRGRSDAAKENAEMMLDFIGWVRENNECTLHCLKTNTELFNYWFDNIYKK